MKTYIRFFTLAVALVILPGITFAAFDDEQGFEAASEQLNSGKYLESLSMYREVAVYSESPANRARAILFMGTTYSLYLEQYKSALKQFNFIINNYSKTPAAADAVFNSGIVLYEMGDYKGAYNMFMAYLKNYPHGLRRLSAEVWSESAASMVQRGVPPPATKKPTLEFLADTSIRVLLYSKKGNAEIGAKGKMALTSKFNGKSLYNGSGTFRFSAQNGNVLANGKRVGSGTYIVASSKRIVAFSGKTYRGTLSISAQGNKLVVVNTVPLEQYLYGVVPKEMPASWSKNALMAQAVAARTYALYIKNKSKDKAFDVEATTSSQVYGGFSGEKASSTAAVNATRGEVMTYDGRLIIAYFHSNSGGHTEDAKNVWSADLEYLHGVSDVYSKNAPNGVWEYSLSFATARKKLNKYGLGIGRIKRITAAKKSKSGRAVKMVVVSDSGKREFTGNNFRIKIGAGSLKSTLFQVSNQSGRAVFRGKGFGHGVGLSQWGARKMSESRYNYTDILKNYYKGIEIMKLSPKLSSYNLYPDKQAAVQQ